MVSEKMKRLDQPPRPHWSPTIRFRANRWDLSHLPRGSSTRASLGGADSVRTQVRRRSPFRRRRRPTPPPPPPPCSPWNPPDSTRRGRGSRRACVPSLASGAHAPTNKPDLWPLVMTCTLVYHSMRERSGLTRERAELTADRRTQPDREQHSVAAPQGRYNPTTPIQSPLHPGSIPQHRTNVPAPRPL